MAYLIAGLGNPDPEYTGTRHSLGRAIVQELAGRGKLKAGGLKFVTPDNYMNNSGASLKSLVKNQKQAEKLIVVHDDLDLPVGSLKISFDKSAGGHRGVESVIKALKTQKFIRLRVGICPITPAGKLKKPVGEKAVVDFLMKPFRPAELPLVKKAGQRAMEALEMIVAEGWPKAASLSNG